MGLVAQQGSGRVAQIHARRCRRDRDIAEVHRSAIARFVDWLPNRVGPVRTGMQVLGNVLDLTLCSAGSSTQ